MSKRLEVTTDKVPDIIKAISSLVKDRVLVGIPENEAARNDNDGEMNNATLGYIHEHGSPAANIPARPWLVPGVREAQKQLEKRLKKAADSALDGKKDDVSRQMDMAGQEARDAVKEQLNSGDFEPLKASTLAARARRGRQGAADELKSRQAGNQPDNSNARPLIDTGQLRNAVNYVVRKVK